VIPIINAIDEDEFDEDDDLEVDCLEMTTRQPDHVVVHACLQSVGGAGICAS
jgi:hypothetical protein